MQPTLLLQLIILAAGHVSAAPVVETGLQSPKAANELLKRADVKPFSCGRKFPPMIPQERNYPEVCVEEMTDNS